MDIHKSHLDVSAATEPHTAKPDTWSQYFTRDARLTDRWIQCLGAGSVTGAYPALRHRRLASHGLVHVTEGEGRYWRPGSTTPTVVRAPAVIWLFPGVAHGYGPGVGGWTERWVLFGGVSVPLLLSELGVDAARPVKMIDQEGATPEATALFAELRETAARRDRRAVVRTGVLLQQLLVTLAGSAGPVDEGSRDAVDALRANASRPWSMAERARSVGLTEEELRRLSVQATGLTPLALVTRERVTEASRLLADTDWPISRIAAAVGYGDPAYFSRVFRRWIRQAPQAFRDQQRRF